MARLRNAFLCLLLLGIGTTGSFDAVAASDIVVDLQGGGDFTDIQAAIDHAREGATVRVGVGEYLISEALTFRGKPIKVVSADGPESTTIRMSGGPTDGRRDSVVVFDSGERGTSVLEGFTLTGGSGTGTLGLYGGGVYCAEGTSPTIVNCTITGNEAVLGGGVYAALLSSPTLADCRITRNFSQHGAGLFPASNIRPDRVEQDPAEIEAGAAPTLVDCELSQNWASLSGGGVFFAQQSSATMNGCRIQGNFARGSGGGVLAVGRRNSLTGCTIAGNASGRLGGGVFVAGESSTFVNCVISGNHTGVEGGGVFVTGSLSRFLSCTIAANGATPELGKPAAAADTGVYATHAVVELVNCIVWNHLGGSVWSDADSRVRVSYSLMEATETWPGAGNIDLAPLFEREGAYDFGRVATVELGGELRELPDVIVETPDYRLREMSPAVDAGTLFGAPDTDIDGNVRPCGAGVDMGAHERSDCLASRFLRGDANGDGSADLADAVFTLNWLFRGGREPTCLAAANTDGNAVVDLTDAVRVLQYRFLGGAPPLAPFPACTFSALPQDSALGCESSPTFCGQ